MASSRRAGLQRALLALCMCLFALGCKRSTQEPVVKLVDVGPPDTTQTAEELDLAQDREAFGLPLPPDVISIQRAESYVTVESHMSSADLEAFYKTRLVDFEILRTSAAVFRIVGLRAYMPEVFAFRSGGRRGVSVIEYRAAQQVEKPVAPDHLAIDSPNRREKGMPVLDRNAEGALIAPGARWGEPYVPPQGSPLHTKRNRANFGRPYGDWITP